MRSPFVARGAATLAAVAILVLGAPLSADAHVKITPNTAAPGDDIEVTFRVPNEMENAGTVKVEIDLPTKTPFAGADYQPVAGWSAQIVSAKLPKPIINDGVQVTEAPVKIIYTANPGVEIKVGQFQQFPIALDLTPNTGSVDFPTFQTYSNGQIVKWDQKTPADGEEPDNPAPTLYINDPPPTDTESGVTIAATNAAASTASTALILGTTGLALGVIALVLGVFAFVRSRRS
ncbi:MAG TPA: YcnI family protein [Galbitalea sp.]